MTEQTSPFSGLDKALLRSTNAQSAQPERPAEDADQQRKRPTRTGAATPAPMRARVHAPGHARTDAPTDADRIESLYQHLQMKQRLASSTFRFRPEELAEMDKVYAQLASVYPGKVSKNDLVRLAVRWLLADYEENGEESTLAQVLARA
jgi:hypothetical protein